MKLDCATGFTGVETVRVSSLNEYCLLDQLRDLVSPANPWKLPDEVVKPLMDYLAGLPDNQEIAHEQHGHLQMQITHLIADMTDEDVWAARAADLDSTPGTPAHVKKLMALGCSETQARLLSETQNPLDGNALTTLAIYEDDSRASSQLGSQILRSWERDAETIKMVPRRGRVDNWVDIQQLTFQAHELGSGPTLATVRGDHPLVAWQKLIDQDAFDLFPKIRLMASAYPIYFDRSEMALFAMEVMRMTPLLKRYLMRRDFRGARLHWLACGGESRVERMEQLSQEGRIDPGHLRK